MDKARSFLINSHYSKLQKYKNFQDFSFLLEKMCNFAVTKQTKQIWGKVIRKGSFVVVAKC